MDYEIGTYLQRYDVGRVNFIYFAKEKERSKKVVAAEEKSSSQAHEKLLIKPPTTLWSLGSISMSSL